MKESDPETRHKIVIGDSRRMRDLSDESVHLVITSPPYWQLKDYGDGRQIGFNDTYEAYINNLNLVWNECHRVLHNGCRMCINVGDQFARSVYYGRYKVIPIRTEIIKFCETVGFDYMGAIIWQKVTTCHTSGGATIMGSYPYPRNGILKLDYEFILLFRKYGKQPKIARESKEQSRLSKEEWNRYFSGHWQFPGKKQDGHLAMFPEELPRRLIKMFSVVGDTVLDPFLGSGTTSLAARNLGRNSVGYEINEDFLPLIEKRLDLSQGRLFERSTHDIVKDEGSSVDFDSEIQRLPYVFKDPIKFDKKVDPKQFGFESRIDDSARDSKTYYRVREVVSPEVLVMKDGSRVRLLGVKEIPGRRKEATDFLREKTKGQKLFMEFDEIRHDSDNNRYCYLYLCNKTFLNAHLIKKGLAEVEESFRYRHQSRFLSYARQSGKKG
jgi:site-specific DNA-methyltransferase (adenine-specific)